MNSSVFHPCFIRGYFPCLLVAAAGAAALTLLAGCGNGKASVDGAVTLDGQPVATGVITFVKADGNLAREGAVIKDGAFQATLLPGKYKLELTGQKVVGKRRQKGFDGADEEVEITAELFPAQYNTNTNLTQDLKPGPNTLKLDLKTTN